MGGQRGAGKHQLWVGCLGRAAQHADPGSALARHQGTEAGPPGGRGGGRGSYLAKLHGSSGRRARASPFIPVLLSSVLDTGDTHSTFVEFNLITKWTPGEPLSASSQAGLAGTAVLEAPRVALIQDFRLPPTKPGINQSKPGKTTQGYAESAYRAHRKRLLPSENGVPRRLRAACLQLFYSRRTFSDMSHLFCARLSFNLVLSSFDYIYFTTISCLIYLLIV